jgi:CRP-like cAMP-binding protein
MEEEVKALERFAREVPAGTVLFREGEPGNEMYVIRAGKVRITQRVRDVERTLGVLLPGEFFGEMAILCDRPRSATAEVIEDARLLVIDAPVFETMLRGSLEIAVRMVKKLAARLADADRQIQTLMLRDHHSRVASYFLGNLEAQGGEYGKVQVDVEEIAVQTGCDYAQVNDALDRLGKLGLVIANVTGGFSIPDRVALAGYLEFP